MSATPSYKPRILSSVKPAKSWIGGNREIELKTTNREIELETINRENNTPKKLPPIDDGVPSLHPVIIDEVSQRLRAQQRLIELNLKHP